MKIEDVVNTVICGNSLTKLKTLPDESVQMCVTSPPYWGLRDYGTADWKGGSEECDHKRRELRNDAVKLDITTMLATKGFQYTGKCPKCGAVRIDDQLGLEKTPDEYISNMADLFDEVKRVLKQDGVLFLNIGDSYASHKDSKSIKQTISSDDRHVMEKGKSVTRDTKMLKSVGLKDKDLVGIPWMLAFELRKRGWYLRQDIIWNKPNPMPESVKDRCTKSHEYIFLLSKSEKYFFDYMALMEVATGYDGRKSNVMHPSTKYKDSTQTFNTKKSPRWWTIKNLQDNGQPNHTLHKNRAEGLPEYNTKYANTKMGGGGSGFIGRAYLDKEGRALTEIIDGIPMRRKRSVWTINTKPYKGAHFACFPEELAENCIVAGSKEGDIVLDPFMGSGTTAQISLELNRKYIGIDLNPEYIDLSDKRIKPVVMKKKQKEHNEETWRDVFGDSE